jgi:hypothetical protein
VVLLKAAAFDHLMLHVLLNARGCFVETRRCSSCVREYVMMQLQWRSCCNAFVLESAMLHIAAARQLQHIDVAAPSSIADALLASWSALFVVALLPAADAKPAVVAAAAAAAAASPLVTSCIAGHCQAPCCCMLALPGKPSLWCVHLLLMVTCIVHVRQRWIGYRKTGIPHRVSLPEPWSAKVNGVRTSTATCVCFDVLWIKTPQLSQKPNPNSMQYNDCRMNVQHQPKYVMPWLWQCDGQVKVIVHNDVAD